jgi:alkylated DNA repair dioxygenase AlkB
MALCSIDKKKLFQAVDSQLRKNFEAKQPFATKDITKFIYDLASKNSGKEDVGLSYAAFTPYMISETIRLKREYNEHAVNTNFDFNDIQKVNLTILKAGDKILEKTAEYIELKKPITPEVVEEAYKDLNDQRIEEQKTKDTPTIIEYDFEAKPDTMFSTTGQQALEGTSRVPDPAQTIYYDFLKVLNTQNKTSQRGVIYPNVKDGLYITFMLGSNIPGSQRQSKDLQKYKDFEQSVFLAITDIEGNPVYFNSAYDVVDEESGTLLYYEVRDNLDKVSKKADKSTQQLGAIKQITDVVKGGKKYISEIIGKSTGYAGEEKTLVKGKDGKDIEVKVWKTISSIPNSEDVTLIASKNEKGKREVVAIIKDSSQGYKTQKNKLSRERLEMIADLIENDVYDKNGKLLTYNQKYAILKNWFSYSTKGVKLTSNKKLNKIIITVNGKSINESKNLAENKAAIIKALATDKYGNESVVPVTFAYLDNSSETIDVFSIQTVNGRLSLISDVQPYQKYLKDNLSVTFELSEVDQTVSLLNGYWKYQPIGPVQTQSSSNVKPAQQIAEIEPKEFTNHSGGAYGGDTFWDIIGREFGVINHKHYKDAKNKSVSKKLKDAGVESTVLTKEQMDIARDEVERLTGKRYGDNLMGNLQVRNYYQVVNSDGIFAIATLSKDLMNAAVTGGTNTAVQLAQKMNKPVFVWDTTTKQWYKAENNKWVKTDTPILTKNFAGVGSRNIESYNVKNKDTDKWEPRKEYLGSEIENAAKEAIRDVYEKTFTQPTQPTTKVDLEIEAHGSVRVVIDPIKGKKPQPGAVVAFRTKGKTEQNMIDALEDNAVGNPFGPYAAIKENSTGLAVTRFLNWLEGNGDTDIMQNYRNALLAKVPELKGKTIYYYKDLGRPSHATALDYFLNGSVRQITSDVVEVAEGVKIINNALTNSEELEIFEMIKPFLESQGSKTNKAKAAPIMIGLGLRWDYKSNNPQKNPIEIKETIVNAPGQRNKYAYYDVSIDGNALGKIPTRLKELITKATGVDASNYDGAIINIYQKDTFISAHNDVDESVTAINYPVLVLNIGGTGSLSIEGAKSQKAKKGYSSKEYIDEDLSSGSAYIFGENGKNRNVFHRTLPSDGKGNLPTLNIKGQIIPANSYRMTVTLRRVKDLEPGMPKSPNKITQSTQQTSEVEAKKANIEKRREKELKNTDITVEDRGDNYYSLVETKGSVISFEERDSLIGKKINFIVKNPNNNKLINNYRGTIIKHESAGITGDLRINLELDNGQTFSIDRNGNYYTQSNVRFTEEIPNSVNKINTKYDAELAALKPTQQTSKVEATPQENLEKSAIEGVQLSLFGTDTSAERKKETEAKVKDIITPKKTQAPRITKDDDIDDLLDGLSEDYSDKLNKLLNQSSEVSDTQKAKALKWYNSIVLSNGVKLSDIVPLTVMFNAVNESNPNSIAHWSMAGITLFKGSNYTDLYHEAFHAFTQQFLSPEDRSELYKATRNKKGTFTDHDGNIVSFKDATNLQLEEYLAEEFRTFMVNQGKSKYTQKTIIGKIFAKIKELLKWLFSKTSIHDIYNDSQATNHISKLFNQLRVGNLNAPVNRPGNFTQDGLYKSKTNNQTVIFSEENPNILFTKEESLIVAKSIDAIFGETMDKLNSKSVTGSFASGGLLQKELNFQKVFYINAKKEFIKKEEDFVIALELELANKNPDVRKVKKLQGQINLLSRVIDVFIIPENVENLPKVDGVIRTHSALSEFLKSPLEIEEELNILNNNVYSDRGGNSHSVYNMLTSRLNFVLSTIYKRDRKNNIKYNWLGFPETMAPKTVIDILTNFLELNDPITRPKNVTQLHARMKALEDELPLIKDVLNKIGTPDTLNPIQNAYWSELAVAILPTVDIIIGDVLVDIEMDQEGNDQIEVQRITMHSSNDPSVKVFKQFARITQNLLPEESRHIYRVNNSNYIDIEKVLVDFPAINKDNIQEFLEAIGIYLPNNIDINQRLQNRGYINYAKHLRSAIWSINHFNKEAAKLEIGSPIRIYSAEDIVNDKNYNIEYKRELNKIKAKTKKAISLPKGQSQEKKAFAKLYFKYSESPSNSSHTSADGKTKYSKSRPNTLTVTSDIINESDSYVKVQANPRMNNFNTDKSSFAKVSLLLQRIYGENLEDKLDSAGIKIQDLDGLTIREDIKTLVAHKSIDSTPNAKQVLDIVAMLIYGAPEATRHAGKSSTYSIVIIDENGKARTWVHQDLFKSTIEDEAFGKASLGKREAVDQFRNYLAAEFERIQKTKEDWAKNIIVAGGKGKDKHTLNKSGQDFVLFDDILSEETEKEILKIKADNVEQFLEALDSDKYQKLNEKVKLEIFNYLTKVVEQEYDDFMSIPYDDSFTSLMLLRTSGGTKAFNSIAQMIEAYAINHLIHNVETSWLFYGDPAQYKWSAEDFHKRNAGAGSTGISPRVDDAFIRYINNRAFDSSSRLYNGVLNTAVLQDPKITSKYLDEWIKYALHQEKTRLTKLNFSKDKITQKLKKIEDKFKEAYENMDEADAQAYINFDTYRILSLAMDNWSDIQESAYQKIKERTKNGEQNVDYSDLNLNTMFPVRKYQYWGPIKNDHFGLMAFHKYSLLPLIPGTLPANSPLETLRVKMNNEKIDYLTYQTGSKISTIGNENGELDKLYSDSQKRELGLPEKFIVNPVFADFLKEQLAIAPKFKGTTVFATQMRKLVIEGLWEKGVPVDYKGTTQDWNRFIATNPSIKKILKVSKLGAKTKEYERSLSILTNLLFIELKEKVGVNIESGKIQDTEAFVKYLSQALQEKEYSSDVVDHVNTFIKKLNKHNGNFDLTTVSKELEEILVGLVYKKIINQKVRGEGLIQVSTTGWEVEGSSDLAFYRAFRDAQGNVLENPDGTVVGFHAMQVKIAMQGDFKKLLEHEDVLKIHNAEGISKLDALNRLIRDENWLNKGDNRKMITMVGPRIPVQGLNSMEVMEIAEFKPELYGNIIVLPSEIVGKSGSDFDVDKLSLVMPNIYLNKGKPTLLKYDETLAVSLGRTGIQNLKVERNNLHNERADINSEISDLYAIKIANLKTEAGNVILKEELELLEKNYNEYKTESKKLRQKLESLQKDYKAYSHLTNKDQKDVNVKRDIETEEEILDLQTELQRLTDTFKQNQKTTRGIIIDSKFEEKLSEIAEELESINLKLKTTSSQAAENGVLQNTIGLIMDPYNFINLLTPNTTLDSKEVSDDMVKKSNRYRAIHNFTKKESGFSGTRLTEPKYNRMKGSYNNVGKEALGIGAVGNTFNSLYNRVGLHLTLTEKIEFGKNKFFRPLVIRGLDHNKINKSISLSHRYDALSDLKISEVISQLINGWVDVEKDEWIFFLQGNRELTPVLLFMLQAGVPLRQAAIFLNQPIIHEYYNKLINEKSSTAFLTGTVKSNMSLKNDIFDNIIGTAMPEYVLQNEIYTEYGAVYIPKMFRFEFIDKLFNHSKGSFNLDYLTNNLGSEKSVYSIRDLQVLGHFWEMSETAKSFQTLQTALNVDTNKQNTLSDVRIKANQKYMAFDIFPKEQIRRLMVDSPLSSFLIQDEVVQMFEPLFPVTASEEVFDIIDELPDAPEKIEKIEKFRNGIVPYVFQLDYYKPVEDEYKGFTIKETKDYGFRAVVLSPTEPGVILYNTQAIKDLVSTSNIENKDIMAYALATATVPKELFIHFEGDKGIIKYLIEREVQRSLDKNSFETISKTDSYKAYRKELEESLVEKPDLFSEAIDITKIKDPNLLADMVAYEYVLRDKALDALNLIPYLFKNSAISEAYANKFMNLLYKHQGLADKYDILNVLDIENNNKTGEWFLTFDKFGLSPQQIDIYSAQLRSLTDSNNILNVLDVTDQEADDISAFFKRFTVFAYLQSSNRPRTSKYNILDLANSQTVELLLTEPVMNFLKLSSPAKTNILKAAYAVTNQQTKRTEAVIKYLPGVETKINWFNTETSQELERPEITPRIFEAQNLFTVTPHRYDKKAISKAKYSTQLIAFAEGIAKSSSRKYAEEVGKKYANTGKYGPKDVIFVSVVGKNRGTPEQERNMQNKTINEAIKAIETGATLITDNIEYLATSDHNTGEKRLAHHLNRLGYIYRETYLDDTLVGVWQKSVFDQTKQINRNPVSDMQIYSTLLEEIKKCK